MSHWVILVDGSWDGVRRKVGLGPSLGSWGGSPVLACMYELCNMFYKEHPSKKSMFLGVLKSLAAHVLV